MSKICPECGKESADEIRFCDSCGADTAVPAEETAPVEEVSVPDTEASAPLTEPADAAEEAAPYAVPIISAVEEAVDDAESSDESAVPAASVLPKVMPDPDVAVPLQNQPDKEKKNKYLGLGIAVAVSIVLLIAALITIVILVIPKGSEAKNAVEKYAEAYIQRDYAYYFSHDYYTVFNAEKVDDYIKQAQESNDSADDTYSDFEVDSLDVVDLPAESVSKLKAQYEAAEYKKVDKIEDIKLVVAQTLNKSADAISIDAIYAVKVDGEWYVSTGV